MTGTGVRRCGFHSGGFINSEEAAIAEGNYAFGCLLK